MDFWRCCMAKAKSRESWFTSIFPLSFQNKVTPSGNKFSSKQICEHEAERTKVEFRDLLLGSFYLYLESQPGTCIASTWYWMDVLRSGKFSLRHRWLRALSTAFGAKLQNTWLWSAIMYFSSDRSCRSGINSSNKNSNNFVRSGPVSICVRLWRRTEFRPLRHEKKITLTILTEVGFWLKTGSSLACRTLSYCHCASLDVPNQL